MREACPRSDETGGIPAYQKRIFDQRLAEIQQKHPDLNLPTETPEGIAHAAGDTLSRAMGQPDLNPVLKYGAEFAGSLYGERRNPLFLGSLFAGPTSAVGETALARIASSALYQGLYNAGLTAAAQPTVQKWQAEIGRESGVVPALQDVGAAFVMGMIPGAAIEGAKELAGPLRRLLRGRPEPGALATAGEGLGPVQPSAEAAARAGEDSLAADAATLTGGPPDEPGYIKDVVTDQGTLESLEMTNPSMCYSCAALMVAKHRDDLNYVVGSTSAGHETPIFHGWAESKDGKFVYDGTYDKWFDSDLYYEATGAKAHYRGTVTPDQEKEIKTMFGAPGPSYVGLKGGPSDQVELPRLPKQPDLHDDLIGAALTRADDPSAPSPEALAAVERPGEASTEVQGRIEQAAPQTPADAMRAADEALDDFGRRDGMAALRERMQEARAAQDEATETWRSGLSRGSNPESTTVKYTDWQDAGGGFSVRESPSHGYQEIRTPDGDIVSRGLDSRGKEFWEVETGRFPDKGVLADVENKLKSHFQRKSQTTSSDVLNKIPMVRKDGSVAMMTERTVRSMGDIEQTAADLVRSCK